ncbi:hypothetical protein K2173_027844 [Erythroxylum novogranatense]|uniref:Uncharacterized protein n=1 Tax=Erythroxylum novogranatense TaxID=1862640 RepID=A0AAV8U099_9ROSI|nr:hypothetical protein K2173_027844 [Erythroxylum novogranatense]
MKLDHRKPSLPKYRIQPRRVLQSNTTTFQTPPGFLMKSHKRNPIWDMEESDVRPEFRSISCELRALAKMFQVEHMNKNLSFCDNSSPLFERGRFYDVYSARRNERLKRKTGDVGKTPHNLGITLESSKKRDSKKFERSKTSRYLLRSTNRENKKPPSVMSYERSSTASKKKAGVRSI